MPEFIEITVHSWATTHPETVNYLDALVRRGVRAAVGSSTASSWVAASRGTTLPREADDIDLFVPDEDFDRAAALLPHRIVSYEKTSTTLGADGERLRMTYDEAIGHTERQIQLLRPHGPMRRGRHRYLTGYSELAASKARVVETTQGLVPIAHPFETVAIYSLLQRAGNKHDRVHTANMLEVCDPTGSYELARAHQIGLDERALGFIRCAGSLAGVGAALPVGV